MTNIERIKKLFNPSLPIDITPSDNQTTYFEWETTNGFVSLEVGTSQYALSYIPNNKDEDTFGVMGLLEDYEELEKLIKEYQK